MDDINPEAAVLSPKPQSPREPSVKSENAPINDLAGPELEAQPEFYAVPAIPSQQSAAPSKGSQKSTQPPVATSPRTSVRSEPIPIPAAATPNASIKSSSVRSPTKVDQESRKKQPSLTSLSKPGPARQPSLSKEPRSISPESIARKMSSPARSSLARSPGRLVSLKNELETKLPEAVRYKTSSPTGTLSNKPDEIKEDAKETIANLEPQGKRISDHIEQLNESVKALSGNMFGAQSPVLDSNIDKIANMSKILTDEANALRNSIKHLSEDIARTEDDIGRVKDVTDFPYHLFLLELIVNKIQMKCDCFDMDCNNLVIAATFLGKHPIILYDSNNGSVEDFFKINVGKSILFAMTYDKICSIEEFEIVVELTKQPPCSHCVTKLGLSRMDYTKEFLGLRDNLCKKWTEEQPKDNIICTTSTPLFKNQFYLSCGEGENPEAIGVIEVSVRMSFLGKEITTAFSAAPKPKGTSYLLKEGNGMTLYSCQKVEMDDQGKILLDEDAITKRAEPHYRRAPLRSRSSRSDSPVSQYSTFSRPNMPPQRYMDANPSDGMHRFDEIFTKMNDNELKIRVPKSTKVERIGKYDKIQELCECEDTPYNTGDQIQFELPSDIRKSDNTYTSNLKYSINPPSRNYDSKDRKIVNITPTNCPVPVNMEKRYHPQKDVFILKIGKKMESKDKKTDLEIELVTPKAPSAVPVENNNMSQQVSNSKLTSKTSKKKDKGKKKSKTSLKKKKSNTKTGKAKKKGKK